MAGRLNPLSQEIGLSVSFLLLVNAEFLIISGVLRSMYYGSVERAANHRYNSNLLQLILQLIL